MNGTAIQLLMIALFLWALIYLGFIRPIRNIKEKPAEREKQRQLREAEVETQRRIADALGEIARTGKSDS